MTWTEWTWRRMRAWGRERATEGQMRALIAFAGFTVGFFAGAAFVILLRGAA